MKYFCGGGKCYKKERKLVNRGTDISGPRFVSFLKRILCEEWR
jgi:hypothetical protein